MKQEFGQIFVSESAKLGYWPDYAVQTEPFSLASKHRDDTFRTDLTEWMVAQSLGIDPAQLSLPRYIPAQIYVGTREGQDVENNKVLSAFLQSLDAAGFEAAGNIAVQFGSIRSTGAYRTKRRKTAKELHDRLTLLQLALIKACERQGVGVEMGAQDREALARAEKTHKAELEKIEAEIAQAKAETEKTKAETEKTKAETEKTRAETVKAEREGLKALAEASDKFVKVIRTVGVSITVAIGTLLIWGGMLNQAQNLRSPRLSSRSTPTNSLRVRRKSGRAVFGYTCRRSRLRKRKKNLTNRSIAPHITPPGSDGSLSVLLFILRGSDLCPSCALSGSDSGKACCGDISFALSLAGRDGSNFCLASGLCPAGFLSLTDSSTSGWTHRASSCSC